jgi:hypothetical protein
MVVPKRISTFDLEDCLKEGLGVTAISKKLGVTKGAVSKALKRIGHVVTKRNMTIYDPNGSFSPVAPPQKINMLEQFVQTNRETRELLNKLLPLCKKAEDFTPKDPKDTYELCIKLMGRLETQQGLYLEMERTWINYQTIKDFIWRLVQIFMEEAGRDATERVRNRIRQESAFGGVVERLGLSDSGSQG